MTEIYNKTSGIGCDYIQHVRSWYGVTAEIAVENNLWHLVRVGGVALHHSPLVSLILRRGQPRRERLYLSFLHEFGHLQTLPVAILHAVWLLLTVRWRNRHLSEAMAMIAAIAVAHQAVWELASEIYVVLKTWREYRRMYHEHPNRIGRIAFWGGMTLLSGGLSLWLVGHLVAHCATLMIKLTGKEEQRCD
jgi:hypothetical protein